jgi:serine protease Do
MPRKTNLSTNLKPAASAPAATEPASSAVKPKNQGTLGLLLLLIVVLVAAYGWNQHWWWLPTLPASPTPTVLQDNISVGTIQEGVVLTDVSQVVDLVKPSIVTVSIKTTQLKSGSANTMDPWSLMFGLPSRGLGQLETEEVQQDIGTGFVVESSGLVVTNKHVVSRTNQEYIVIDGDNNEHAVTEIYRDPDHDLALLQVENLSAPALELGESEALKVGQGVIAVGTALG